MNAQTPAETGIIMESPEYLQTSLASSMTLGFRKGLFWRNAKMTCVNVLLTYKEGCRAACQYCGLQRKREGGAKSFIRVPWQTYKTTDIINALNKSKIPKRVCISMITHKRAVEDTIFLTKRFTSETRIPLSVLISPTITTSDDLREIKKAGADKIGVAFDLPTEELFDVYRGKKTGGPHNFEQYKKTFVEAVEIFGDWQVGSHFMVGMGETEKEMLSAMQWVHDHKGVNHLFSFFPEAGTQVEDIKPPALDKYRRIQIGCHLIDLGETSFNNMKFNHKDEVTDFGVTQTLLDKIIDDGKVFMTRGCHGNDGEVACNRPFANSFPGPELRNYPFRPNAEDIELIKTQLKIPDNKI